mmetsp:Transcript_33495/g.74125  ORF Transcript_33495/g.74125 Transcript_33495/m.74125 type:complete len:215 (-) Transcript_33495:1350-1994(-)
MCSFSTCMCFKVGMIFLRLLRRKSGTYRFVGSTPPMRDMGASWGSITGIPATGGAMALLGPAAWPASRSALTCRAADLACMALALACATSGKVFGFGGIAMVMYTMSSCSSSSPCITTRGWSPCCPSPPVPAPVPGRPGCITTGRLAAAAARFMRFRSSMEVETEDISAMRICVAVTGGGAQPRDRASSRASGAPPLEPPVLVVTAGAGAVAPT